VSSPTPDQARRDGYEISTDPDRLDRETIHAFLRTAYWSPGIEREVVDRGIDGSIPFGLYGPDGEQAGFARAVTDGATFAWIADVFVLEPHRGRGLGVWLVEAVLAHPEVSGVRRVMLGTADAHGLYERFGFGPTIEGRMMIRPRPTD
jgi:GNAT superfamily N-acetyltransferase